MKRRDFLRLLSTTSLAAAVPGVRWLASPASAAPTDAVPDWSRLLVLVELKGGNDGLNTLVPYADPTYYSLRPQLAIPREQVHRLSPKLGLHPSLEPLMKVWRQGHLAVVRGVGYPDPNRSHFRSIDIWETASEADEYLDEGWLARLFRVEGPPGDRLADGVVLGNDAGPLEGEKLRTVVMSNPGNLIQQAKRLARKAAATENPALQHILKVRADVQQAADRLAKKMKSAKAVPVSMPGGKFGRALEGLLKMYSAGLEPPVVKVTLGGFDTHAGQAGTHANLMRQLGEGLAGLHEGLSRLGMLDRVLVMTYSEFGRRPAQNASAGTDHGTAAPHFVMGTGVKGGLHGRQPSLTDLVNRDLRHHVHFRDLYTTVARRWFGVRKDFLGGRRGFEMEFLKA